MNAPRAAAAVGSVLALGAAVLLLRGPGGGPPDPPRTGAVQAPAVESRWLAAAGTYDPSCVVSGEAVVVRGDSLGALAQHGETLELLRGYYQCNPPRLGEVVALAHGNAGTPLAKVIHARPGDSFSVALVDGAFRLLLRGEPARNSQGQMFFIDEQARRLLQHYADSHQGRVPEGSVLLLSDKPVGTVDGRRFGLVPQAEVLGRLVR